MSEQKPPKLFPQLIALMLARLFLNIGLRIVYPFAPALARGLGVELTAVYRLITLRNLTGFLSPLFGPLSERYGRRPILLGAMLLGGFGGLITLIWPTYWALGITLILVSIAKIIYDPVMQAFLGDNVPYEQRGRAVAITETSWALGLLVGAPLAGYLIQRQGWQSPFAWMGLFSIISAVMLWRIIPHVKPQASSKMNWRKIVALLKEHPVVWAAFVYITLLTAANEMFFIVYGDWMEESFELSLSGLGLAAGIIGSAEIVGEFFVGWAVDRFGKRQVIIITASLNALVYMLIPASGNRLIVALVMLFFLFLFFEITLVGGIPLMTELVPKARGLVLSILVAATAFGRTAGAFLGPIIWQAGGLGLNSRVTAVTMLIAVLILARWVREESNQT